jgi:phosphopantetheine adenylyltransferase
VTRPPKTGAYPGTFNPPTVAHLAIAEAARSACGLDRVDLVLSLDPIGKAGVRPTVEERAGVLRTVASSRPWLSVVVTEHRLLADIAEGYDVLVLGADKWAQVIDVAYYDDVAHRDDCLARLPHLAVAPRASGPVPEGCTVLEVGADHVSSSAARAGAVELMLAEAVSCGLWTA